MIGSGTKRDEVAAAAPVAEATPVVAAPAATSAAPVDPMFPAENTSAVPVGDGTDDDLPF